MLEPSIHWVRGIEPHRLALMPRPRGGEWLPQEVAAWHAAGIGTVVSLLERHEVAELELAAEPALCAGSAASSCPCPSRTAARPHRAANWQPC
jgi:hypothetical protein